MTKVKANNIEIEYDTFGDPSLNPLLLVMGLGAQMITWFEEMCELFVNRGFYVIRFDNRDVGLSTKFEKAGEPDLMKTLMAVQRGKKVNPPYTLDDMADDAVGLLDALNIEKAHICGASLGGMIVQNIAIRYPSRVLSLTSIMSSTSDPDLPPPKPEALQVLIAPSPKEREAYIKEAVKRRRVIHGSGFPFDEIRIKKYVADSYDRCFYPQGMTRQMVAAMVSGSRKAALSSVKVPTLIIHGGDDPLMPIEGGRDTAESIPGAELLIIDGMGHSLPQEVWDKIVDAITVNAAKAIN